MHSRISSIYPSSGQNPSFGQLYVLDFTEANCKVKLNKSQNILFKVVYLINYFLNIIDALL